MQEFGNGAAVTNESEPGEFEVATLAHYAIVEMQMERMARALEAIAERVAEVKIPRGFRR